MKVVQMLRLSIEEMFYIEAILSIAIDNAELKKSKRYAIIESVRNKIVAALEQAEKDGVFDSSKVRL